MILFHNHCRSLQERLKLDQLTVNWFIQLQTCCAWVITSINQMSGTISQVSSRIARSSFQYSQNRIVCCTDSTYTVTRFMSILVRLQDLPTQLWRNLGRKTLERPLEQTEPILRRRCSVTTPPFWDSWDLSSQSERSPEIDHEVMLPRKLSGCKVIFGSWI